MTTHIFLFRPRFVEPIRAETKLQTIRRPRKRPVRAGDELSLRHWTKMPYRSPQAWILPHPVRCVGVCPVILDFGDRPRVVLDGRELNPGEMDYFAVRDGFSGIEDMQSHWKGHYPDPEFEGVVTMWDPR